MLFGYLNRVAIIVIDLKESIQVKFVRKIMRIFSSSICALYTSSVPPIFVLLLPNLLDMLTIAQRINTLHCVFLYASLFLLACFQVGTMKIIYAVIHISRSF